MSGQARLISAHENLTKAFAELVPAGDHGCIKRGGGADEITRVLRPSTGQTDLVR